MKDNLDRLDAQLAEEERRLRRALRCTAIWCGLLVLGVLLYAWQLPRLLDALTAPAAAAARVDTLLAEHLPQVADVAVAHLRINRETYAAQAVDAAVKRLPALAEEQAIPMVEKVAEDLAATIAETLIPAYRRTLLTMAERGALGRGDIAPEETAMQVFFATTARQTAVLLRERFYAGFDRVRRRVAEPGKPVAGLTRAEEALARALHNWAVLAEDAEIRGSTVTEDALRRLSGAEKNRAQDTEAP